MKSFPERFEELPQEVRVRILKCLEQALLYRGWDSLSLERAKSHACEQVQNIGVILATNGCEVPEYT